MTRRRVHTTVRQITEINLTPMMDLTFILLITFIITFPLLEQGIQVKLPKGKSAPLDPEQSQTITVDDQGALFLNNQPITDEALAAQIQELAARDPQLTVLVRGDEGIAYGRIVDVLKILKAGQVTRMALVTQRE